MIVNRKEEKRQRRKARVRLVVSGTAERPRLSVYRSLKHMYAQVIDDGRGVTLAAASTVGAPAEQKKTKTAAAKGVGERIARACLAKSIEKVVFDRDGFEYHGRVAAVADGAREAGLKF